MGGGHFVGVRGRRGLAAVFAHGRRRQTVEREAQIGDFEIKVRAEPGEAGARVTAHVEC